MSTIIEQYEIPCKFPITREFVVGLELEIETVYSIKYESLEEEYAIAVIEDGSLRNGGYEFLIPPSNIETALNLFDLIHSQAYCRYREGAFSNRTSIHVHVNCLFSTETEVKNLLLLYSIFEPLFFSFVGQERKNNIHCVPLGYTHMSQRFPLRLFHLCTGNSWHKYTAFNLLPLTKLGTVEFRHMEGHNNRERLAAWLHMIKVLWDNAHNPATIFSEETLKQTDWLANIEKELLIPEVIKNMKEPISFELNRNLIDVKLGFM